MPGGAPGAGGEKAASHVRQTGVRPALAGKHFYEKSAVRNMSKMPTQDNSEQEHALLDLHDRLKHLGRQRDTAAFQALAEFGTDPGRAKAPLDSPRVGDTGFFE